MASYCDNNRPGFAGYECLWSGAPDPLRDYLRLLWEQHIYWTRMVIIGLVYDLPNLAATTDRLLRNAPDFGNLFSRFYGPEIGTEFERLIRAHLVIAADLVTAAKTGNTQAAADAERRWYANGDEIVRFMHRINPYWSLRRLRAMWYEHLALTKEEAVTELGRNYAKSIATFDRIEEEALIMADEFAGGIARQFGL